MENLNVLSLFDGISCGYLALQRAGINVKNYYASEINESAIKITMHHNPDIVQLGDVKKIKIKTLYLSEVYSFIIKKYFNNDIHYLQSIIPESEMLDRINEEQTMSAYFGTQIEREESKIPSNPILSVNDRIWFWKNKVGNNKGIYNIVRSGERRKIPNNINVGELCKHSFWWNGDGTTQTNSNVQNSITNISTKNIEVTLVECEWGILIFKGRFNIPISGSPCQGFSFAGYRKGMTQKENIEITSLEHYLKLKTEGFDFIGQSYLFWEYIRLIRILKPKHFLLENVSMNKKWKNIISKELGVLPININSNLVSIQNRKRLYWTNIPNVSQPTNLNININDVIPNAIGGYGKRGIKNKITRKYEYPGSTRKDGKINCITTSISNTGFVTLNNGFIRKLTINEVEIGQTLPIGYTNVPGVSQSQRWHGIGNGWTINVISHIFKSLK